MAPSSLTLNYDALLSTTLMNYRRTLEDEISKANALLYTLMKKEADGYEEVSDLGERYAVPLMYALGKFQAYSGADILNTDAINGLTTAFYDWRQAATPIVINAKEEKQNSSESRMINLLETKTKQATLGIKEGFGKALLQGNGPNSATAITTAFTDTVTGASFIDPLPLLVNYLPTDSISIGNINQSTYSWWQNQYKQSAATTYAAFLGELRQMYHNCSQGAGPGGSPNLFVADQLVFELYERALASFYQNPSYTKADIPFDNILFKGSPIVWDEWVPDVYNGTVTSIPVAASGTMYFLNTKFLGVRVHKGTNFSTTPFLKPTNQDAKVAHILWLGLSYVSNRRKQGVIGKIATTTAS